MITDFPHRPPEGYSYEMKEFNSRMSAIWLCSNRIFDYNLGKPTRTIWGFYNSKKKEYLAPINSSKPGNRVRIQDTTQYSAMPIHQSLLESCFI